MVPLQSLVDNRKELILTSVDGHRQIFDPGDDFIVPKGWSGTWQLSGQYREIATFETRSLDAAMQRWFGK